MSEEGLDVSGWQGEIDWFKSINPDGNKFPAKFAIIRAGSINNETGVCWEDYQYRRNIIESKKYLPDRIATYWYFRPNHSAVKQAQYYIELVKDITPMVVIFQGYPLTFRGCCDIEVAGQAAIVKAFVELFCRAFPGETMPIYTSAGKLAQLTGDKTWMKNYPLWMADWTYPYPIPAPWTNYLMHQYAVLSDGEAYGMKSAGLDHDKGNFYFNIPIPPPPTPEHPHPEFADLYSKIATLDTKINAVASVLSLMSNTVLPKARYVPIEDSVARRIKGFNGADNETFDFYPTGSNEDVGNRIHIVAPIEVLIEPYYIGDGGFKGYLIVDRAFLNEHKPTCPIFVDAIRGHLQAL